MYFFSEMPKDQTGTIVILQAPPEKNENHDGTRQARAPQTFGRTYGRPRADRGITTGKLNHWGSEREGRCSGARRTAKVATNGSRIARPDRGAGTQAGI